MQFKKPGGFILGLRRPDVFETEIQSIYLLERDREKDRKDPRWNETVDIAPGLHS